MSKVPISACLIAKNEEKYLEGCLQRLKPCGFEIVVTDTGSTDRTKEIAAKYADKVLDFEWIDDFSAARNFCAKNASNNWILSIDCDEYVNDVDVPKIRILTQKFPHALGIINITNIILNNGEQQYGREQVVRFYNRRHFSFINRIHEQLMVNDPSKVKVYDERFIMPMELIHHGYAIGPEEMKKKQERNLNLLLKSLENNPELKRLFSILTVRVSIVVSIAQIISFISKCGLRCKPRQKPKAKQLRNLNLLLKSLENNPEDPYACFQVGQSHYVLGNYEEAIKYYDKALSYNPSLGLEYVQLLIVGRANAYKRLGRYNEELQSLLPYVDICKSAKFTFIYAIANYDNDEILKALMLFIKATTLPDAQKLGENLTDCYRNIIAIYRKMGENDMANMFVEKYEALVDEKKRILNA